jgi:HK97 family phage major capsid protein/HK97 family phage prohead protease
MIQPPRDNLVRASAGGFELRDGAEGMPTIFGHAAVFNQWTTIDSAYEGKFMERIAPGAFRKTIAENRPNMRMLFNHGQDPQIGDKPIAPIETLEEDATGLAYSGRMLDTSYNRDLIPGLRAGLYGSSFRFRVVKEDFNQRAKTSDYNPDALPERTIQEAHVMEFGAVTFPAYSQAGAGLRSMTDAFVLQRLAADPERLAELVDGLPKETAEAVEQEDTTEPEQSTPEEPAQTTPERVASKPTLTRKEPKVADLLPDERASRMSELENEIKGVSERYTGKLPLDVKVSYEANKTELANLQEDEREYQERKVDLARIGAKPEHRETPTFNVVKKPENIYGGAAFEDIETRGRNSTERNQLRRDYALRGLDTATFAPIADAQRTRDRVARLIDEADEPTEANPNHEFSRRVIATGDPVYKRAWNKLLANGGNVSLLSPEEQRGTALAMNVTTTGGFLVPYGWDPSVVAIGAHTVINPYRRTCKVIDLVGSNIWHGLTSTAVTVVRGVEALVAAEAGPTFAQPAFTPSRVQTQVTYSIEAAQDRADLGSELATLIQEGKDNEEEATFSVGTGATTMLNCVGMTPPAGTSGAYTSITAANATSIVVADLQSAEVTLPVRFRMNAQWFMTRKIIRYIQGLETAYGQYFNGAGYQNPGYPAVGNPEQHPFGNTGLKLLGYPVNESPSLPSTLTTGLTFLTFCDPSTFVIVDRVGMDVEFIPFIFGSGQGNMVTGQRALYAIWRNACGPLTVLGGLLMKEA